MIYDNVFVCQTVWEACIYLSNFVRIVINDESFTACKCEYRIMKSKARYETFVPSSKWNPQKRTSRARPFRPHVWYNFSKSSKLEFKLAFYAICHLALCISTYNSHNVNQNVYTSSNLIHRKSTKYTFNEIYNPIALFTKHSDILRCFKRSVFNWNLIRCFFFYIKLKIKGSLVGICPK